MEYEELRFDLSGIDLVKLKDVGISVVEILQILKEGNTRIYDFRNPDHPFTYAIGYLDGNKFIQMAYRISKDVKFDDIELLQVGIPDGEDIKRYWCK